MSQGIVLAVCLKKLDKFVEIGPVNSSNHFGQMELASSESVVSEYQLLRSSRLLVLVRDAPPHLQNTKRDILVETLGTSRRSMWSGERLKWGGEEGGQPNWLEEACGLPT